MSDEDDWDVGPIQLKKPVKVDEDDERVQIEVATGSSESSKPKNAIDEKAALAKANAQTKTRQKERDEELARIAERERNARPMTAEEKAADALRLRQLQEESENELMKEMFGAGAIRTTQPSTGAASTPSAAASVSRIRSQDGVQDIDSLTQLMLDVQLDTPRQSMDLATAMTRRFEMIPKKSTVNFLGELLRETTKPMTEDDVNELIGVLTVIKNDKVKQKFAKKKAAGVAKPKLNTSGLDKPGGDRFDMDGVDAKGVKGKGYKNPYEDDDDGFM